MAMVPCGSCHLCCVNELVILMPEAGDVVGDYLTKKVRLGPQEVDALQHRENGECVYLGPDGCTIHDRSPVLCREYDCRLAFKLVPRHERRRRLKMGLADKARYDRGRELLPTLT